MKKGTDFVNELTPIPETKRVDRRNSLECGSLIIPSIEQMCKSVRLNTLSVLAHRKLGPGEVARVYCREDTCFKILVEVTRTSQIIENGHTIEIIQLYVSSRMRNHGIAKSAMWSVIGAVQEAEMPVEKVYCNEFIVKQYEDNSLTEFYSKIETMCKGTGFKPLVHTDQIGIVVKPVADTQRRRSWGSIHVKPMHLDSKLKSWAHS